MKVALFIEFTEVGFQLPCGGYVLGDHKNTKKLLYYFAVKSNQNCQGKLFSIF